MDQHTRAVPRALHRARLWTAGLLTASTLLVGGIGVHLAEDRAAATAQTSGTTGATSSVSSTSSDDSSDDGSDDRGSTNQSGGFSAVAPLQGSNAQAQSNSKAS